MVVHAAREAGLCTWVEQQTDLRLIGCSLRAWTLPAQKTEAAQCSIRCRGSAYRFPTASPENAQLCSRSTAKFTHLYPGGRDQCLCKLIVRAGLSGATNYAPVPRAPALDLCPGRLATTDAQ